MFFFWRNKDKPQEPRLEAVPTWNHLARIHGLGSKPTAGDILIVFNRFAKLPFYGDKQRLCYEVREGYVRLERCFGKKGCFVLRMALPVTTKEVLDFPLAERRAFLRALKANPTYQAIKKVPIEALSIAYES